MSNCFTERIVKKKLRKKRLSDIPALYNRAVALAQHSSRVHWINYRGPELHSDWVPLPEDIDPSTVTWYYSVLNNIHRHSPSLDTTMFNVMKMRRSMGGDLYDPNALKESEAEKALQEEPVPIAVERPAEPLLRRSDYWKIAIYVALGISGWLTILHYAK